MSRSIKLTKMRVLLNTINMPNIKKITQTVIEISLDKFQSFVTGCIDLFIEWFIYLIVYYPVVNGNPFIYHIYIYIIYIYAHGTN